MTTAIGRLNSVGRQYPIGDIVGVRLPIALLLALPMFAPVLLPSTKLLSLAVTCAIYVIVANGLHVVFSYAGQLSLAQSTLWGVGAYAAALLIIHQGWPTPVLLPAAGMFGAAAAIGIGIPAFRTAGFSFAIITFAFGEILRLIGNNWTDLTRGSTGLTVFDEPTALGSIRFDTFDNLSNFYLLCLAFAYLSLLGVLLVRQSSLGRTFITIRENEALARSLGVNVYVNKLIAFGISGFFAGVAGVLFVYHQKHIDPGPLSPFGAFFTIQFLLMILIGGRFSMLGPTIGAVVVVFGPELANFVVDRLLGSFFDLTFNRVQIFFGMTLAISVLTAPHGIAGQTRDGYNAFVLVGRHYRERGRGVLVSTLIGLAFAFWPRAAQRRGINIRPEGSN